MPPLTIEGGTASGGELQRAIASIEETGIVVVQYAFDPALIFRLLANVHDHVDRIVGSLERGETRSFPARYRWHDNAFACDISALDPNTRDGDSDDFNATTLHGAVMTPLVQSILSARISDVAGFALVRVRLVLPRAEKSGALSLHKEITAIRFPGIHVIWTPLIPDGIIANVDAPGVEFELPSGEFFRPEVSAGDVLIFHGEISHRSHIPPQATHWRAGCDIRVFPWTEENLNPEPAIAMGYHPQPLKWIPHNL